MQNRLPVGNLACVNYIGINVNWTNDLGLWALGLIGYSVNEDTKIRDL